jgi:hypothetical protein
VYEDTQCCHLDLEFAMESYCEDCTSNQSK